MDGRTKGSTISLNSHLAAVEKVHRSQETPEGKAISAMNAHSGYFRRRVRLGHWLLWAKYHTSELTPALIAETIVRADKLNIELPESRQHQQFLRDMAFAGMEAALAEPYRKIYGCYMTQLVISAARKLVVGKGE
jgi:hypothetical protein